MDALNVVFALIAVCSLCIAYVNTRTKVVYKEKEDVFKKELKHYKFYDCAQANPFDVVKAIKDLSSYNTSDEDNKEYPCFTFRDIVSYMNIVYYQEIDLMMAFVYLEKNGFIELVQFEDMIPSESFYRMKKVNYETRYNSIYGYNND